MTQPFAMSRRGRTLLAVLVPLLALFALVAIRSGPLAPAQVSVAKVKERTIAPAPFGIGTVEARSTHKVGPPARDQPPPQPRSGAAQRFGGASTVTTPTPPATPARSGARLDTGLREPEPWAWGGGKHREPVLDLDRNPPRVVRSVGWRICIRCSSPFWSADAVGVRLWTACKGPPATQTRGA